MEAVLTRGQHQLELNVLTSYAEAEFSRGWDIFSPGLLGCYYTTASSEARLKAPFFRSCLDKGTTSGRAECFDNSYA